jgi:bifunctional non-homologous end joining protein LigD
MPAKQEVDVEGRRLALTNLDKVLYPGSAYTKAHVIDYYMRVAKWLLPHFAAHPVTLQRFPDGVRGKAFYEKDAPKHTPAWVHTTKVPRQAGGAPIRYICVDDLPTLLWCANVASLELHPFLHRAKALDCPTSIVFDLDPGEGVDLTACAEVAFLVKALLEKTGLQCFPKVSGSKGLQLYAPLNTPATYAQTRSFAQSVAQILERRHPKLIVAEMAKERRRQKVFIDWSQNSDFKTTIGVYSLRAKNDVPYVSAPVAWIELDELRKKRNLDLLRFAPDALLKRVAEIGDLFAPLLTLKQTLSPIAENEPVSRPKERTLASDVTTSKVIRAKSTPRKLPEISAKFVEPMLLLKTNKLPEGKDWLYEIKFDGYRALALKTGGQVDLRSRKDKDLPVHFAPIVRALETMPDDTVVDGEVVALDEEGRPSFNLLQNHGSSQAPIVYYALTC